MIYYDQGLTFSYFTNVFISSPCLGFCFAIMFMMDVATKFLMVYFDMKYNVFISSPCHSFCFATIVSVVMDVAARFPSSSIKVPSDLL